MMLAWNRMRYWWLNIYFFFRKSKQYTKHYVSTQNNLHYIYISTQKLLLDKNPHTLRTHSVNSFLVAHLRFCNIYSFLINCACEKWLTNEPTSCLIPKTIVYIKQKQCYSILGAKTTEHIRHVGDIIHQLFITTTISSCTWGRAQVHLHLYKTVFLSWDKNQS